METLTRAGIISARIEQAKILDVNIDSYTVSIATAFSQKPQTGISFSVPYTHYANGEGIIFMPEVGSLCWVCFPSDSLRPFVLAWAAAANEGNFRANRPNLNPGDISLSTRDENFLVLRRGGVVEIGGGPLNQRIFLPINNTIKDFCENYGLHTIGGDLEWNIAREENTTDGSRPSTFLIHAREFANDPNPLAQLEIGSHQAHPSPILNVDKSQIALSLIINASGQNGAAANLTMIFEKDGSVVWNFEGTVNWVVNGDINVTSETGSFTVVAKDLAQITADALSFTANSSSGALLQATGGYIDIKGSKGVRVKGPGTRSLIVDGGSAPVILATPAMIAWIYFHYHTLISPTPGSPTTPPVGPVLSPTDIQSKSIFSD